MKKIYLLLSGLILLAGCDGGRSGENNNDDDNYGMADSATALSSSREQNLQNSMTPEQPSQDNPVAQQELQKDPLSVLTFCHWDNSEKAMTFLDGSKVFSKLKSIGFVRKSDKSEGQYEDDASGEIIKERKAVYQRDHNGLNITVSIDYNSFPDAKWITEVKIKFPNSELKDEFLRTAVTNRYKKVSDNFYRGEMPGAYTSGSDIKVNGNEVKIEIVGEA